MARLYREPERGTFLEPDERPELCALELQTRCRFPLDAAVDPQSGAAPGHTCPFRRSGPRACSPGCSTPGRAELSAAVHLGKERRAEGQRHPPHGGAQPAQRHGVCAGNGRHRWCGAGPVDKLCHAGCLPAQRAAEDRAEGDNPGAQELEAGHAAARAGDWPEAAARYTAAAEAGSAGALSALGDCLYYGRGTRKNKTGPADVEKGRTGRGGGSALALGDDCAASGGEMAETLQYYRRAQSAAGRCRTSPTPRRSACVLPSTRPSTSPAKRRCCRWPKLCRAFGSLQAEGETDAADWLRRAELLTDQLLADDKNA